MMQPRRRQSQPLDRAALTVMGVLVLIITAMLLLGSQALPGVRTFSWQREPVKATDVAFLLTFTQPVKPESVEKNLVIEPPLPGKISWAGRRMAYTLDTPAPYGEAFKISLPEAQALSGQDGFEPFNGEFHTRDRAFAYIGAEGEEKDRLVIFNLTSQEKTILTSADQVVLDFQPYPQRDRILFSAVDAAITEDRVAGAQLYSVTTGLSDPSSSPAWQFWKSEDPIEAGRTELVVDNRNFQNLKFDLAPNGENIVVQRVEQDNPANYGPWLVQPGEPPRKIKTEPGGDFQIAPDSESLLIQQGKGTAVIDLNPDNDDTQPDSLLLDFLPEYGLTLDIAADGTSAALVNFNQDDPEKRFTQSLFLVSNRGDERNLLQTDGSIVSAQFNSNNEILYCLINQLTRNSGEQANGGEQTDSTSQAESSAAGEGSLPEAAEGSETSEEDFSNEAVDLLDETYTLSPYLVAINVETGDVQRLLEMPPQPETTVSVSPDGLAILFDEMLASDQSAAGGSATANGPGQDASQDANQGATHRLWLLPLLFNSEEERLSQEPTALAPTELKVAGRHPIWLP